METVGIKKQILYLFVAWFVISLLIALGMKSAVLLENHQVYTNQTIISYFIIQVLVGFGIIALYVIPLFNQITRIQNTYGRIGLFILQCIVFNFGWIALFSTVRELFNHQGISPEFSQHFFEDLIENFHHATRTYLIFLSILLALDYFKKSTDSLLLKKNLENEVTLAKLSALKAQLQPHFLFNALNTVVALMDENKTKAQQALINLSDLLRYTIGLEPDRLVDIDEEISVLKKYIAIEKSKHEDNIVFDWDIASDTKNFQVPPLIVQPLVENAIKHGYVNHDGVLNVIVKIQRNKIEVWNNGAPITEHPKHGQGLTIVKKRLSAHYFDKFSFRLYQKDGWVINEIWME